MDPDRFMMEKEIREFVVRHGRDENNRLLFYYAGHGYSQKMGYGGQMGYLVLMMHRTLTRTLWDLS